MAIAITEGCIDDNADVVQVCSRGVETSVARGDSGGGGGDHDNGSASNAASATIPPFHRHCQKTVCSAYQGGAGLTWPTINILTLDNLSFITEGWKSYFTGDSDNMTDDLASILKLIDKVAGNVARNWNLRFYADGDATHAGTTQITSVNIKPWNNTSIYYDFRGFSRDIILSIGGKPIKFNTMRNLGGETLAVDFDKNDITVKFNGTVVGRATNIYMPVAATIDINQDYNHVPFKWHDFQNGTIIDGFSKAIRYSPSDTTMASPKFKIHSKYLNKNPLAVVEWEFHVKNLNSATLNLTIDDYTVQVGDTSRWFTKVVGLTDQLYVEAGKTNVYVFRGDM